MGARWYNPATGSFGNKDTVGEQAGPGQRVASPFGYAADNPLDRTDPTGHYVTAYSGPLTPAQQRPEAAQQKASISAAANAGARQAAAAARTAPLDAHQLHLLHSFQSCSRTPASPTANAGARQAAPPEPPRWTPTSSTCSTSPTSPPPAERQSGPRQDPAAAPVKPYDGPVTCAEGALTQCMAQAYAASGGQFDANGIPNGKGYPGRTRRLA